MEGYENMSTDWLVARIKQDDTLHLQLTQLAWQFELFQAGQTVNGYNAFERIKAHAATLTAENERLRAALEQADGALQDAEKRLRGAGMYGEPESITEALAAIKAAKESR